MFSIVWKSGSPLLCVYILRIDILKCYKRLREFTYFAYAALIRSGLGYIYTEHIYSKEPFNLPLCPYWNRTICCIGAPGTIYFFDDSYVARFSVLHLFVNCCLNMYILVLLVSVLSVFFWFIVPSREICFSAGVAQG